MDPGHLHSALTCPPSVNAQRLEYLLRSNSSVHYTATTYMHCSERITNGMRSGWTTIQNSLLSSPTLAPILLEWPLQEQPGSVSTVHMGVGHFHPYLHKWGVASSVACEHSTEEQTVNHVVQCLIHQQPYWLHSLMVLDDKTIKWLLNTCPEM